MTVRKVAMLLAAGALVGAAGGAARAADKPAAKPLDFTVRTESSPMAPGTQTMKWDAAKGHWGLTLDLKQPEARETTLSDIKAGAYYKITPALRVGGAFAFGDQQLAPGPKPNAPDPSQPRVQFETKLKF